MRRWAWTTKQLTAAQRIVADFVPRHHMLDPQEFICSRRIRRRKRSPIFREYRKICRKANAMDFDDLLSKPCGLLKSGRRCGNYNGDFDICWSMSIRYESPRKELMRLLAGDGHTSARGTRSVDLLVAWGPGPRKHSGIERDFPEAKIVVWSRTTARRKHLEAASVVGE